MAEANANGTIVLVGASQGSPGRPGGQGCPRVPLLGRGLSMAWVAYSITQVCVLGACCSYLGTANTQALVDSITPPCDDGIECTETEILCHIHQHVMLAVGRCHGAQRGV